MWKSRSRRASREELRRNLRARIEQLAVIRAQKDQQKRESDAALVREREKRGQMVTERDAQDNAMLEAGYVSIRKLREYVHETSYSMGSVDRMPEASIDLYLYDVWSLKFFRKLNEKWEDKH